jgi:hypothetical protein
MVPRAASLGFSDQSCRLAPQVRSSTATPRVPLWVAALDAIVGFMLVLMCFVFLWGGYHDWIGPLEISFRSWRRLLLSAVGVSILRHAVVPRPALHTRAIEGLSRLRANAAAAAAWTPFVATRAAVLLAGYFAVLTIGFEPGTVRARVSENELTNLAMRWDAEWYLSIARHGYSWNGNPQVQQPVVFFPVLPIGMHIGAFFSGGLLSGGLVFSLAAFFAALVYLYRFTEQLFGDRAARGAVWAIAAYPFAVYYSVPYTESIYLLGCVAAFFHFTRAEWRRSALWGLIVGLSRPNGFVLAAPLAFMALQQARLRRRVGVGELVASFAPVAGLLAFSLYLFLAVGDGAAWLKGQAAWERVYVGVWPGIQALVRDRYDHIAHLGWYHYTATAPFDAMHTAAAVLVLLSIPPTLWCLGAPYALFMAINILPPLIIGGTMSIGRMTSVLFPAFMWIGDRVPPQRLPGLIAFSCVLQGLIAVAFFTWRAAY